MAEKWIHLPVSWAHWHVLPNLRASELKPCDGFYLMGTIHSDAEGPRQLETATRELQDKGFKVIPTAVAFSGSQSLSAWFDPQTWRHVGLWCYAMASGDFAVDFESYWDKEPRYPAAETVRALAVAARPLIEMVRHRGVRLHLLPGLHYPLALALASALPGQIVDCDEATYAYGDAARRDEVAEKRGKAWHADVLDRKLGTESMGHQYRPGFFLPALTDPVIQEGLKAKELRDLDSWYYPRYEEAKLLGRAVEA
jgi:hypothetical protein